MTGDVGSREGFETLAVRHIVIVAIVVFAAALRIAANDVTDYSPADETHYRDYTRVLVRDGWSAYPTLVRHHVDTPAEWPYPSPLRYGHFAITTTACALAGSCDYRTLAWISTLAGIAMVVLVSALAGRVFGEAAGVLAAAFVATSPLQLGLGRRALQDELAALTALAALAAVLWARGDARTRAGVVARTTTAVVLTAAALAIKEAFALWYPALVAAYAVGIRKRGLKRRDAIVFLAPPLVYVLGFALSARSGEAFFALARIVLTSGNPVYIQQYESGPAHRLLADLFVLAPVVCLLAAGAATLVALRVERGDAPRRWTVLLAVFLLTFAVAGFRNVRFIVASDTIIRMLAAWLVVAYVAPRRWILPAAAAVVVVNAAVELWLFRKIFVIGNVYDPQTVNVLRALEMVPR